MHTSKLLRMVVALLSIVLFFVIFIPLAHAQSACPSPYTVQAGENWRWVVLRCGVSFSDLKAANPGAGDTLTPGDVLIIPGVPTSTPTASPTNTPTATNTATNTPTSRPTATPTATPTPLPIIGLSPSGVVRAFYQAVDDALVTRDFRLAYNYLSSSFQSRQSYDSFVRGYQTTRDVIIEDVHLIEQSDQSAKVYTSVRAIDDMGNNSILNQRFVFDPHYLVVEGRQWRLNPGRAIVTVLDQNTGCQGTLLAIGDIAQVTNTPPVPNRVRIRPSKNTAVVGRLQPGETMEILDGPVCANDWLWWYVQGLQQNLQGWTAEGDGLDQWLLPVSDSYGMDDPHMPWIGPVSICLKDQFQLDSTTVEGYCTSSTTEFYGNVQQLYFSIPYANTPTGTKFTRKYYRNGVFLWETSNSAGEGSKRWSLSQSSGHIWMLIDAQQGNLQKLFQSTYLPQGEYRMDLYVNDGFYSQVYFTISSQ